MSKTSLDTPKQAFRYPGGKGKIAEDIVNWLPCRLRFGFVEPHVTEYCEPFVGSGAILARVLPLLPKSCRLVLGDMDIGIVAFWKCIADRKKTDSLCVLINNLRVPHAELFYELKEKDGDYVGDDVDAAFRKMVLHFISFSGVGAKAGGPIGGREQGGKYNVSCRWNPDRNIRNITSLASWFSQFAKIDVVHGDFKTSLSMIGPHGVAYLDPPYYLKGSQLYTHNMSPDDHARLAKTLKSAQYDWVLSYDDHERIHKLYGKWADIKQFEMTATIDTRRGSMSRRKNHELVILKRVENS